MREILFRGKRVDNGEWIYGDVIQFPMHGIVRIIEQNSDNDGSYGDSEIDCDTLGQYTGLTDKNGRKIFEGDIVTIRDSAEGVLVEFIDGEYQCTNRIKYKYYRHPLEYYHDEPKYTVIGNIHDNPELLEVTK